MKRLGVGERDMGPLYLRGVCALQIWIILVCHVTPRAPRACVRAGLMIPGGNVLLL